MREVIILLYMTTIIKGIVNFMTHSKHVNVVDQPVTGYLDHVAMARSYGVLKPVRGKIDVSLRNDSKADNPPKVDYCGRDHSSKCCLSSFGAKANRVQVR